MKISGPLALIGIIVIAGAILAAVLFLGPQEESETPAPIIMDGNNADNVTEDSGIPDYSACEDYKTQEDCESDSFLVECENCECVWENSSCILKEASRGYDLEARSLSLGIESCNSNQSTCDIIISGLLVNSGEAVNEKFFAYFAEAPGPFINLFEIESISSGESINLSYTYENVSFGSLFVKFFVDSNHKIDEINEGNNEKNDAMSVP